MSQTIIDGTHWLDAGAAASYARARAAGMPAGITSAGRDHEFQKTLFLSRYKPQRVGSGKYGDVRRWNGTRYVRTSAAGPVGVPGTSKHETGLALDVPAGGPREWLHANGARFGWIANIVKGEPWHFEYQAGRDTAGGAGGSGTSTGSSIVRAYQMRQNKYGNAGLKVDGVPGPKTEAWRAWVKTVQAGLNLWKSDHPDITVDGDYGNGTHNRVAEMQRRNGRTVTGVLSDADAKFMRSKGTNIPNRPKG